MAHQQLIDKLHDLLSKNYDAEKGYKRALRNTENPRLLAFLKKQAFLHARFATEFEGHLHSLNDRPVELTTLAGSLHRVWIDLRSAVNNSADDAVLEECLRGEKAGIREYEEKLKTFSFPLLIKLLLEGQLGAMKDNIINVHSLADLP